MPGTENEVRRLKDLSGINFETHSEAARPNTGSVPPLTGFKRMSAFRAGIKEGGTAEVYAPFRPS